jgi:DNA repair protein RadA/Sms
MQKNAHPVYFCGECGYESSKWLGKCPGCGSWNTMVESAAVSVRAAGAFAQAQPLSQVDSASVARTGTGMAELDRVLGGGVGPGMTVLIGGDPGIGKSTLLLQVTAHLATQEKCCTFRERNRPRRSR